MRDDPELDAANQPSPAGLGLLRLVLGLQMVLGLLWGISMLVFARQIVLGDPSGPHIEKIAMEGAAHMMLVFGAFLVWRAPTQWQSRGVLLMMVFLNALWTLTDLVYIPLLGLSELDFYAKVNTREVMIVDRDPWSVELYQLQNGKMVLVGKSDPTNQVVLTSAALPLTFQLRAGTPRPTILVTHTTTGQTWTA